jgi:hypothetical protein
MAIANRKSQIDVNQNRPSDSMNPDVLSDRLLDEATQLCNIVAKSVVTAKNNKSRNR